MGVWDVNDSGDVPPRAIIKGESTFLVHPAGVAINPKDGEVYATDSVRNGLFTFLLTPYFFANWPTPGHWKLWSPEAEPVLQPSCIDKSTKCDGGGGGDLDSLTERPGYSIHVADLASLYAGI